MTDVTAIVIQARMGSSRLPGKILMRLDGKPILQHVIERAASASAQALVAVATTNLPSDDGVAELASRLGVGVIRGSERDVFSRYHLAAKLLSADILVRLTSDCPLIDPATIAASIKAFRDSRPDYLSAGLAGGYGRGLDVEVFSNSALERAAKDPLTDFQREHVTPVFYQNSDRYRIQQLAAPDDLRSDDLHLCVDTAEDYKRLCWLHATCRQQDGAVDVRDCIRLLRKTTCDTNFVVDHSTDETARRS